MIFDFGQKTPTNALMTVFVFTGGESEPPVPPIEFGPGSGSRLTLKGSGGDRGVTGSNAKNPIGGYRQ